jgi:hypothetical protein
MPVLARRDRVQLAKRVEGAAATTTSTANVLAPDAAANLRLEKAHEGVRR